MRALWLVCSNFPRPFEQRHLVFLRKCFRRKRSGTPDQPRERPTSIFLSPVRRSNDERGLPIRAITRRAITYKRNFAKCHWDQKMLPRLLNPDCAPRGFPWTAANSALFFANRSGFWKSRVLPHGFARAASGHVDTASSSAANQARTRHPITLFRKAVHRNKKRRLMSESGNYLHCREHVWQGVCLPHINDRTLAVHVGTSR